MKKPMKFLLSAFIILIIILFFMLFLNLVMPTKNLPDEAINHINKLSNDNPDDMDFLKAVHSDIKDRYAGKERCWRNYFWRNWIYNGITIWELEGECLTCNVYNNLFQAYLLESKRFSEDDIIVKVGFCPEATMIHIYTEVTLKNQTKINVDTWGADFNIPFGKTIQETEACNK